ncbi:hypothetical protein CLV63_115141 [Murinocardiopsis flavida]|uniref:Uncharacterized protein n=1 Tax=Murinocardiopsis flavida TaxID=645275 RepID=A0A2P8DE24_9ACTN|nr:hypothetical protein CLV63_115141 [Murinocardiopsis flavida]
MLTHPPTRAPEGLPLRGTARKRPRAPGGETAPEARRPRARASVTPREQEPGCRKACAAATADTHPALRPPGPTPHGTHRNHTRAPQHSTPVARSVRGEPYASNPDVCFGRRCCAGSPAAQPRSAGGKDALGTHPRHEADATTHTPSQRPTPRHPRPSPPRTRTPPAPTPTPAHPSRCSRTPTPSRLRRCFSPQTTRTRPSEKAAQQTDRPHNAAETTTYPGPPPAVAAPSPAPTPAYPSRNNRARPCAAVAAAFHHRAPAW